MCIGDRICLCAGSQLQKFVDIVTRLLSWCQLRIPRQWKAQILNLRLFHLMQDFHIRTKQGNSAVLW